MTNLTFNYPEGVFLLAGAGLVLVGSFLAPRLEIADPTVASSMAVAGALSIVAGCLLFLVDHG